MRIGWIITAALLATPYACGSGDNKTGGTTASATATSASATGAGGAQASAGHGGATASGTTASTSGPTGSQASAGPSTASAGTASSSATGGGCLKCAQFAMMANADPSTMCPSSKPLFDAFHSCVCVTMCMAECGQACQQMGMFPPACQQCAGMKCMSQIQACMNDK